LGLKKTGGFDGPDEGFFPDFGFYPGVRVDPPAGGSGEKKFNVPTGVLEFQPQENGIIPIMSGSDQNEGLSGIRQKGLKGFPGSIHRLTHQIFKPVPSLQAFFLPGSGLGWGQDVHEPRRATVAQDRVRVWDRETRVRVTPRVRANSVAEE